MCHHGDAQLLAACARACSLLLELWSLRNLAQLRSEAVPVDH